MLNITFRLNTDFVTLASLTVNNRESHNDAAW